MLSAEQRSAMISPIQARRRHRMKCQFHFAHGRTSRRASDDGPCRRMRRKVVARIAAISAEPTADVAISARAPAARFFEAAAAGKPKKRVTELRSAGAWQNEDAHDEKIISQMKAPSEPRVGDTLPAVPPTRQQAASHDRHQQVMRQSRHGRASQRAAGDTAGPDAGQPSQHARGEAEKTICRYHRPGSEVI